MKVQSEGDNAFGVYRWFLWFIGVWPMEEKNNFQFFRYIMAITAQVKS
jgi:hypothetical protein